MNFLKKIFLTTVILTIFSVQSLHAQTIDKTDNEEITEINLEGLDETMFDNGKTVQIDLGNGAIATIGKLPETTIEPFLNTTTTVYLQKGTWTRVASDTPYKATDVRVENKSGNPGIIDVWIKTDYYTNGNYYFYNLNPSLYVTISIRMPSVYDVYVTPYPNNGNYKIQVSD